MRRAWLIPVGGAALAPLVTWWPMLAYRFPWLGMPPYQAAQGIDFWGAQTFWFAGMVLLALIVGAGDKYLGIAIALIGLMIFWRGARIDPTHSVMFALGAVMIAGLRRTPVEYHAKIKSVLVGLGVFELLYVLQQLAGYDLLWGPLVGGTLTPNIQPLGTLGTVDAASAYIAVIAPLMPWWVLPVVFLAIWKAHSVSATLALAAGLFVKGWYRPDGERVWNHRIAGGLAGLACVLAYYSAFAKSLKPLAAHLTGRGAIWGFAAKDWITTDPILGYGLGGWSQRVPALQVQRQFAPTGELWREAHNEYLQWVVELGLVGLVLMALWLWSHRTMFAHPVWGGSLAALGVNALTFFPLHVVQLSLVAIILVGLATAPKAETIHDPPQEWGTETGD
jgi:O-antigen ligase/polysaccharide polymerase Wzy-like membrane protein